MKRIFLSIIVFLTAAVIPGLAQEQHAHWRTSVEKLEKDLYRVSVTAAIDSSWHIYDTLRTEFGPNATIVEFSTPDAARAEKHGEMTVSAEPYRYYDDIFMMEIGYYEDSVTFSQDFRLKKRSAQVDIYVEWMACDENNCMPLADKQFTVALPETATISAADGASGGGGSLWGMILEAIMWGFVALLTPCVFPMVPMTVSYFLKGEGGPAKGRMRAAMYGIFIVALYTLPIALIILITRIVGGDAVTADIFNWLATHWLPNIIFFLVFMVFAASFFGAFELTMPSRLVNKSDSKADTKGFGGIFFLALTLVLVSFSCTGPIVGMVLIKSTQGEFWAPILTMLAFSIAFALPFTIFALFPSNLKKLPKSGGWLNTVKVEIAFIEVALGFNILSTADQTYHRGILDRQVIVFSFVVYLIPGMWGAPLKALSGYLPPLTTQDFVLGDEAPVTVTVAGTSGTQAQLPGGAPKYSDFLHLPHGLQGFFELEEARAYAESVNKPLFIDFTGHGCVNCREMEARVWSDPRVLEMLRNDFVVVALYCDDKKEADESDWITAGGRTLKTIGKINSHIAYTGYGVNAQPCYVLEGRGGKLLAEPRSYDLDVDAFVNFLRTGIDNYNK